MATGVTAMRDSVYERIPKLMVERWMTLSQNHADVVLKELDEVLAHTKNADFKIDATFSKTQIKRQGKRNYLASILPGQRLAKRILDLEGDQLNSVCFRCRHRRKAPLGRRPWQARGNDFRAIEEEDSSCRRTSRGWRPVNWSPVLVRSPLIPPATGNATLVTVPDRT